MGWLAGRTLYTKPRKILRSFYIGYMISECDRELQNTTWRATG
jgi:hypothetical protein